jgi:hypothetical protein
MTTIITRLYPDEATAQAVAGQLTSAGHAARTIDVITAGADLHGRLAAARVPDASAAAYAGGISAGNALLVVRAPFNPIGAANHAMSVVDRAASIDAGVVNENAYVREQVRSDLFLSVLTDHPLFFTPDMGARKRGPVSEAFGMRLLSRNVTKTSAVGKGRRILTGSAPRSKTSHSASMTGWTLSRMLGLSTVAGGR